MDMAGPEKNGPDGVAARMRSSRCKRRVDSVPGVAAWRWDVYAGMRWVFIWGVVRGEKERGFGLEGGIRGETRSGSGRGRGGPVGRRKGRGIGLRARVGERG